MSLEPYAEKASRGHPPADEVKIAAHVEKAQVEPIRQTVTVRSDPEYAFELFTEEMGSWWPVDAYSRAVSEFADEDLQVMRLEFQARMGGCLLEHMSDGRILPWGGHRLASPAQRPDGLAAVLRP